jgi:hypothetical protein
MGIGLFRVRCRRGDGVVVDGDDVIGTVTAHCGVRMPRTSLVSGAAWRAEESAPGVHPDQRPRRVCEPASTLVVERGRGQHGQGVMEQVSGVADGAEDLDGDRDEATVGLGAQPVQVFGWDAAQPPAHGRFRSVDPCSDPPESETICFVYQSVSDDLGGVGAADEQLRG